MNDLDLNQALNTALKACRLGRQVLLDYFGQLKKVQEKAHAGLVSEADIESEKVIAAELARGLPGVGVLGEEAAFANQEETVQSTMWVVDPLDGTTNYVHGFPIFCISIGLQWKGELAVGVVDVPMLNKTYTCAKGQGAFVNGERIVTSRRKELKESLLATGFIPDNVVALKEQIRIFSDLVFEARGIRRAGAAAYDLCLVAEGVFDAFWEKNLKPWDTAAGCLMVREAGGVSWTYSGAEYKLGNDSLLSGNRNITPLISQRISALQKAP
jgi:myo-inositol-1(or 4)-monophosphatase